MTHDTTAMICFAQHNNVMFRIPLHLPGLQAAAAAALHDVVWKFLRSLHVDPV